MLPSFQNEQARAYQCKTCKSTFLKTADLTLLTEHALNKHKFVVEKCFDNLPAESVKEKAKRLAAEEEERKKIEAEEAKKAAAEEAKKRKAEEEERKKAEEEERKKAEEEVAKKAEEKKTEEEEEKTGGDDAEKKLDCEQQDGDAEKVDETQDN